MLHIYYGEYQGKNYIFDPGEYNAKAVKEFYNAIGMGE